MAGFAPGGFLRRAGANLSRAARRVALRQALPRRGGVWLVVRVEPDLDELTRPRVPFGPPATLGLLDVLATLDAASRDTRLAGVLLRFGGPFQGLSRALSLRRAVQRLRECGKPVVAYGETWTSESLVAASGATRLWLPESGTMFLVGLRLEGFYLRRLLEQLEIRPEVVRVGSHKTAAEHLTRSQMSPEEREQLEALADDLFGSLVEALAAGRGLDAGAVRDLIDRGPYSAPAAVEAGLADGCLYPDEVERELVGLAPETETDPQDGRPRMIEALPYHALEVADPGWRPLLDDLPRVAYVVGSGTIHRGRGHRGIASDTLRETLERVRREDGIRGMVLRIDSPGGDGVASDLLWRAVSLVKQEKPVVVSMGNVVASGGYYMAAAADVLYAETATVTGSIGVVGGKVDLDGLYKRLGVAKDSVERGRRAGLLSEARGFTAEERSAMQGLFDSLYGTFVDRVAEGRGIPSERVAPLAGGRVWSGTRAQQHGLVDAIGGPLDALHEVCRRAGLAEGERYLLEPHPRLPPFPSWLAFLRWRTGPTSTW
ncbi:MAG: signal peptide peptidase SppA [Myxococcota bacterium]|nr:signal peptide peptidase SppA [Myxococcota bacterium]